MRLASALTAVAAATLLIASPAIAQQKKVIKLSHSHQASMDSEIHTAALEIEKYIAANSKTLEVKIYANNALGQERDVYEGMQLGSGASCAISGTAILNNFNKRVGVLDLPFMWRDYEHVHKTLDGAVGATLAKELEGTSLKVLAWMDSWGYRNVVTAKKEVKTVADLKGLKIRTIQTPVYVSTLNVMGANATPMAFGEVYTAMQTGVLDGFEHGASVTLAQKFYEVSKYMTLTRHLFGPLVMACSAKEWNALSGDEKDVLQKAALRGRDVQRAAAPTEEAKAFDQLKAKGMIINTIDLSSIMPAIAKLQEDLAKERGATDLLQQIKSVH